jgi:hypothetical protein
VFVPENEKGVFYIFCKYHEKLGFERILRVNADESPDLVAECDGKEVRIELEYDLRGLASHYLACGLGMGGKWRWDQKYGLFLAGPHHDLPEDELKSFAAGKGNDDVETQIKECRFSRLSIGSGRRFLCAVSDPKQLLRVNYTGSLVYKSLKTWFDCVICWKKGNLNFHDPKVDLIVLKNRLKQLRLF